MSLIDDILTKFDVKFDDLNTAERETLNTMLESLQKKQLTVEKIKEYIGVMRDSVEMELTKIGHESKQDIFLKARLRNYMLLESFLASPEKARLAIERSLQGIKPRK